MKLEEKSTSQKCPKFVIKSCEPNPDAQDFKEAMARLTKKKDEIPTNQVIELSPIISTTAQTLVYETSYVAHRLRNRVVKKNIFKPYKISTPKKKRSNN